MNLFEIALAVSAAGIGLGALVDILIANYQQWAAHFRDEARYR